MRRSARTPWSWSGRSTSTSRACARSWETPPTLLRRFAESAIGSMSRSSRARDVRAARGRPLPWSAEPTLGVDQVGGELRADDPHGGGGLDAETNLTPFDPHDGDADIVA